MPINPVTSGMVSDKEFLARKMNEIIGVINLLKAAIDPRPEAPSEDSGE